MAAILYIMKGMDMRIQGIDQTLKAEKKEAKDLDNNFFSYKKTL